MAKKGAALPILLGAGALLLLTMGGKKKSSGGGTATSAVQREGNIFYARPTTAQIGSFAQQAIVTARQGYPGAIFIVSDDRSFDQVLESVRQKAPQHSNIGFIIANTSGAPDQFSQSSIAVDSAISTADYREPLGEAMSVSTFRSNLDRFIGFTEAWIEKPNDPPDVEEWVFDGAGGNGGGNGNGSDGKPSDAVNVQSGLLRRLGDKKVWYARPSPETFATYSGQVSQLLVDEQVQKIVLATAEDDTFYQVIDKIAALSDQHPSIHFNVLNYSGMGEGYTPGLRAIGMIGTVPPASTTEFMQGATLSTFLANADSAVAQFASQGAEPVNMIPVNQAAYDQYIFELRNNKLQFLSAYGLSPNASDANITDFIFRETQPQCPQPLNPQDPSHELCIEAYMQIYNSVQASN